MSWAEWARAESERIRAAGRWREVRSLDASGPEAVLHDGAGAHPVVSFASNDYLGLSRHPGVVGAAHAALDRWGAGAGAARLVSGSRPVHAELEEELAAWKATEAAVLFPTGYAANLGVLTALGGPEVVILSDELNHASIVDGCRLARAAVAVYPHRDVDAVDDLLAGVETRGGRAVVVSDSVFSMDGEVAPVGDLAEVCARHGALLVLDEAHAVLGPALPATDATVLRVGTLSKALGSLGGFVAGTAPLCRLLVNLARPFVFTTASSPADTAAALAAVRVVRSPEGERLRGRLAASAARVARWARPPGPGPLDCQNAASRWRRSAHRRGSSQLTPIVPITVGSEEAALAASAALLERGAFVPAIRPPTVPAGTARLRIAVSAAHTTAHLDALEASLAAVLGAVAAEA